jgi:hypothetical protein
LVLTFFSSYPVKRKWAKLAQAYAQADYNSQIVPEVLFSKISSLISYARTSRLGGKEPEEPKGELPISEFDLSWYEEEWAKIRMDLQDPVSKEPQLPPAAPSLAPQPPVDVSNRIERVENALSKMMDILGMHLITPH